MIGTIDVEIQAHNPSMPLFPMRAFQNSPSSIRVRNVPKKIGSWQITKVYFTALYPDGSLRTVDCKLVGGVWVGTIVGSEGAGYSENGYTVYADGIDENGNAVAGYALGKGDIQILAADGQITPDDSGTRWFVTLLSGESSNPKDGQMFPEDGQYFIWQDGEKHPLGTTLELDSTLTLSGFAADAKAVGDKIHNVELSVENQLSTKQDKLTDAEQYALSNTVYDLATKFYFTDNTTSAFSWNKDEVTFEDFVEAGLVDAETSAWIKQPRNIEVGEPVQYFHQNAFSGCTNLANVIFYGKVFVAGQRYYPWGIANTNVIQPFYTASRYWVEQQGYALNYPYSQVSILPFGTRTATLQPYKVNYINFASQAASFRVDVGGSAGTMRDLYFVFTVPSNTQPMTWNTYFDRFEGGDAASVAPTSGTNIYHIYEYASGKFAVEKFDNIYTKANIDSKLSAYVTTSDISDFVVSADVSAFTTSSDVTAIVTSTANFANFTFDFVSGNPVDMSLYRAVKIDSSNEPRYNIYYSDTLILTGVLLPDDETYPKQINDNVNGSVINVTRYDVNRNSLGFATYDQLSTGLAAKQDKLTDFQLSAVQALGNSMYTEVAYSDSSISSLGIVGLLDYESIPTRENAVNVKIGNAVATIGALAFEGCFSLSSIAIPDSVTTIQNGAFTACTSLSTIDIPSSVATIGADAFDGCTSLTRIVVHGKSQAEAEALLANALVPEGCEIIATNEWGRTFDPFALGWKIELSGFSDNMLSAVFNGRLQGSNNAFNRLIFYGTIDGTDIPQLSDYSDGFYLYTCQVDMPLSDLVDGHKYNVSFGDVISLYFSDAFGMSLDDQHPKQTDYNARYATFKTIKPTDWK